MDKLDILIDIQRAQLYYTIYKDLAMGKEREHVRTWARRFEKKLFKVMREDEHLD